MKDTKHDHSKNRDIAREVLRCKVCTKIIDHDQQRWQVWLAGAEYATCCPVCAARFKENPELYLVS